MKATAYGWPYIAAVESVVADDRRLLTQRVTNHAIDATRL